MTQPKLVQVGYKGTVSREELYAVMRAELEEIFVELWKDDIKPVIDIAELNRIAELAEGTGVYY